MNNPIKIFPSLLIVLVCFFSNACNQRIRESEGDAIRTISTIREIQSLYASKNSGRYARNFDEFIQFGDLNWRLRGNKGIANGYMFEMNVSEPTENSPAFYSITADPPVSEVIKTTGSYHFYSDANITSVKVTEENRQATANDPSI